MKLRHINTALVIAIALINGYIIAAPFMPVVSFWWQNHDGSQATQLTASLHPDEKPRAASAVAHPNGLIVPSMLLDQPIQDGPVRDTYKLLAKGIWRWPTGSTPDKGGNTTLIGHRFTYTQPKGVFYYLDKVRVRDEIGVWWNDSLYRYRVSDIKEVSATTTSIQDQTSESQLTIFTCTPLWLPHNRLVIIAKLEEVV